MIMSCLLMTGTLGLVGAETEKIYPSDDAFVRGGAYKSNNFNSGIWKGDLRIGYEESFDIERSFLKFDIPDFTEEITSATLSLKLGPKLGNPELQLFFIGNNSWDENSINWKNQPNEDLFLIDAYILGGSEDEINFEVSSFISESTNVSFLLRSSVEGLQENLLTIFSKDYNTSNEDDYLNWPYLEITYEGSGVNYHPADTDQSGDVSFSELNTYANNWVQGLVSFDDLMGAANLWANN